MKLKQLTYKNGIRLYKGDLGEIAQKTGYSRSMVTKVLKGSYYNYRIMSVAYVLDREKKEIVRMLGVLLATQRITCREMHFLAGLTGYKTWVIYDTLRYGGDNNKAVAQALIRYMQVRSELGMGSGDVSLLLKSGWGAKPFDIDYTDIFEALL